MSRTPILCLRHRERQRGSESRADLVDQQWNGRGPCHQIEIDQTTGVWPRWFSPPSQTGAPRSLTNHATAISQGHSLSLHRMAASSRQELINRAVEARSSSGRKGTPSAISCFRQAGSKPPKGSRARADSDPYLFSMPMNRCFRTIVPQFSHPFFKSADCQNDWLFPRDAQRDVTHQKCDVRTSFVVLPLLERQRYD